VADPTPDGFEVLAKARMELAPCASPSLAAGKLYLRTNDGLACYDLAAAPTARR